MPADLARLDEKELIIGDILNGKNLKDQKREAESIRPDELLHIHGPHGRKKRTQWALRSRAFRGFNGACRGKIHVTDLGCLSVRIPEQTMLESQL